MVSAPTSSKMRGGACIPATLVEFDRSTVSPDRWKITHHEARCGSTHRPAVAVRATPCTARAQVVRLASASTGERAAMACDRPRRW